MKKVFKGLLAFFGMIAAAVSALAVIDKFTGRNRIEGNYLDCSEKENDEQ